MRTFGLAPAMLQELSCLRTESEAELRGEGMLQWAIRAERAGQVEAAAEVYGELIANGELSPALRRRAGERREVLGGSGPLAARLEHNAAHLTQEVLAPSSILAMGAGGAVFRMTRWAMLGRLSAMPASSFSRGPLASALAGFSGFLLEAPAFTLSSHTFRAMDGEEILSPGLGSELLRSYVSLGGLRLGGVLSQRAQRGFGLSPHALSAPFFHQAGMFGGIWAGGLIEESVGLHPERSASNRLFDSLTLLLHFNLGGRVAQQAFGPNFRSWEMAIDRQSASFGRLPNRSALRPDALRSPWLAPMWMAMGAGGLGGFGSPCDPQLRLPFMEGNGRAANDVPNFSAPDLVMAQRLRQATPAEWSQGLEQLRSQGHLLSEPEQISWILHLRQRQGIGRLGEIFRGQGPAAAQAGRALLEFAALERPAVLHELRLALVRPASLLHYEAMERIVELNGRELLLELQALSGAPDSPIATAAESARLRLGDATLIPELRQRAQDRRQEDADRIAAWEGLGKLGARQEAIDALRLFFRHYHSPGTQVRAALSLSRIGASAAVLSLGHHLSRASIKERAVFARVFFEHGQNRQGLTVWEGLARNGYEGRRLALQLTADHPQVEMIPLLRSLIAEPIYSDIRIEAGRALVRLARERGDTALLESLLERFEPSSLRDSESLQVSAAHALLAQSEHASARELLRAYLHSSLSETRLQAAEALLERGESPAALETLRALSQSEDPSLRHRAAYHLLGRQGFGNASLKERLGSSLGLLGLGLLSGWLHPSIAEASVGAGSAESSWLWSALLIGGTAALGMAYRGRGSEPPTGSQAPRPPLAWFENPADSNESHPIHEVGDNGIIVGRSTAAQANVFGPEQRQISRRHMDLRIREGRVEVRVHEGSRGLRINGNNLLPLQWYRLRDQDLVEFVSESSADLPVLQQNSEGEVVQGFLRLGQRPVEAVEQPAIFRFRLGRVSDTPIPPRPRKLLDQMFDIFRASSPVPESAPPAPPVPEPPRPALREAEEIFAEINRLSQTLSTPMGLLEMALRSPDFHSPESRADTLTALIRIHRQICGNSSAQVPIQASESGAPHSIRLVEVPSWDGLLAQRLQLYENGLRQLEQQRGPSLIAENARGELGRIRDQLNRLFEMVRLFRRHFREPEELARFDAIEQAYRGLRPELPQVGQRVRSSTRGLDATVRPSDRHLWTEEFLGQAPSSRAVVNLRILMGEVQQVRGRALAGNFYKALASGTIYEGRRNVRFYYDNASGQILGFDDGSPAADTAIQGFRRERLQVEEGIMAVDPAGSGRIVEVTLLGSARPSVAEGLTGLQNLRVLPPQVVHGWTGREGEADLRLFRLHLVPEFESPREEWYRVAGLIRRFSEDQSLLTVEPLSPSPQRQGVQLLVPEIDLAGVSVDDVLTVHAVSP